MSQLCDCKILLCCGSHDASLGHCSELCSWEVDGDVSEWLMMFWSGVLGQFERAPGKPNVGLRSQQMPVNIAALLTPHWPVNVEFCRWFQWDPVFLSLGMPSAGLSQRNSAKEVSCKEITWSSQVLQLRINKVLFFTGRAYWWWTHWNCLTTRTSVDFSESEFSPEL